MPGKHLDLDLDNNLGGDNPADVYIPSQKAIKTYVDGEITTVNGKIDAIEIVDELAELQDVGLSEVTDGQALTYDAATNKWKNKTINTTTNWGSIGGTLSEQTDLNTALAGKANISHTHTKSQITDLSIPTNVSELNNDAKYVTETALASELTDYQTKITSTNKVSSDLIDDSNKTNKFVTAAQMSTWNGKQDAITDLATIRAGASAGATALQAGDNISALTNDAGYLTSTDITSAMIYKGTKAKYTDLPTSGNKVGDVWNVTETGGNYAWDGTTWDYLGETLDLSGYVQTSRTINGKALTSNITLSYSDVGALSSSTFIPTVTDTFNASSTNAMSGKAVASAISGKQDTISDLNTIRANASSGADAATTIASYGDIVTHSAAEFLTEHQDISGKANTSELSSVAFSGSYNDLDNKPAIPTTYSDVGAASSAHTHSYSDVGAASSAHTHSQYLTASDITGKANVSEVYTKLEIDGKLTGAMTFKGTVSTVSALPSESNKTGDMYNVKSTGANYAWDGTAWDKLSENVDLSGLVPNTRKVNGKALNADISLTYTDVNAASNAHTHTYSDVGAASSAHTHSYTYSDVGAASAGHTHTYSQVGAASASHTHSDLVPNTRTIAGKALSSNITLSASDVGALPSDTVIPTVPTKVSAFTNDAGYLVAGDITGKANTSELADVAFSGAYTDLSGTPTIPSTYSDVGAASAAHTHNYVPLTRTINEKQLTSNITLSASDVGALPSDTAIPSKTSDLDNNSGFITSAAIPTQVSAFNNDAGYLTEHQSLTDYQKKNTAVTHTASTSVGNNKTPVYVASDGKATALSYTIEKSVPSDAKFTDTTYTGTAGVTVTGTQIKHTNSVTASTVGTNTATSGKTLDVPYVTYDAQGHVTGTGVHTHTVSGFLTSADITGKADLSALATVATTGDYADLTNTPTIPQTYSDVGAASASHTHNYVPTSRKVAGKALTSDITLTYTDVSAASDGHTHTYSDVGAASSGHTHSTYVPTTRKVAGKALSSDVTLTYSDVNAASDSHTHTYSDVGAASENHTHTYGDVGAASAGHTHTYTQVGAASAAHTHTYSYSDVGAASASHTHSYSDVGAASSAHTHTYSEVGAASTSHTHTYSDVGAASSSHTHSNYVTTGRKVAGHALTADVTISASDIGDLGTTISSAISGKANTTEVYSKSEIDGKLSGAMHFKGTKASEAALPTTGNTTGDMWNVTDTGANYAWDGTAWDKLSENIDLSGVVPNTRKVNNKTLDSDITLNYSDVGAASTSHTHSYTYSDVGAASASHTHSTYVPTTRKVAGKALTSDITLTYSDVSAASSGHTHTYGDVGAASASHTHTYTDVGAASSAHTHSYTYSDVGAASSAHTHTYSDVGAASSGHTHSGYVPTTRKVAGKALSSDVSISYSDVGAASTAHTHTYSDVGAASSSHTHSSYVPTTRKVAGKALSSDVSLTYSDVSAASSGHTHSYSDVGAASVSHTHTYSDVGAASSGHTHSEYVPTSRTVAGKALTSNITLTYGDVGAASSAHTHSYSYSDVGAASASHTHSYTYSDVGAASASHTHSGYVPTTRKVAGKALSSDITLTYSDVSAASSGHSHTYSDVGAASASHTHSYTYSDVGAASSAHTHTYSEVGAASSSHTHSGYVPTGRTVNGKALSSNVTIAPADITMTNYAIASSSSAVTTSDTLNQAIAKIEYKANIAASGSITVGQLSGPSITPSNPTVTCSVSGSTVTINGVAYTSGDLVTAILAGTAPSTLEIVTHSNLRCYVYNSHYYRRDTLADIT